MSPGILKIPRINRPSSWVPGRRRDRECAQISADSYDYVRNPICPTCQAAQPERQWARPRYKPGNRVPACGFGSGAHIGTNGEQSAGIRRGNQEAASLGQRWGGPRFRAAPARSMIGHPPRGSGAPGGAQPKPRNDYLARRCHPCHADAATGMFLDTWSEALFCQAAITCKPATVLGRRPAMPRRWHPASPRFRDNGAIRSAQAGPINRRAIGSAAVGLASLC